jgi:hypothetical protein
VGSRSARTDRTGRPRRTIAAQRISLSRIIASPIITATSAALTTMASTRQV